MPEGLLWSVLITLTVIFLGWFAVGTQQNVRKGSAVMKWVQHGLPLVGERTTMRWLGSSVLELKIVKAKNPFRSAETLAVFEPRDVIPLWFVERMRGRRDLLIFRAQLQSAPSFEMSAFDPKGWMMSGLEQEARKKNWVPVELTGNDHLIAFASDAQSVLAAKSLIGLAARSGGKLVKFSVTRALPNLELQWHLPQPDAVLARDLFLKVRELAESAVKV